MAEARSTLSPLFLQWAKATLPAPNKGDDTVVVLPLPTSSRLLVGVADGITHANGRAAAEWVASTLTEVARHPESGTWSVRDLYAELLNCLDHYSCQEPVKSRTTLTCGLVSAVNSQQGPRLRFDFFAVGDSPVWVVHGQSFGPLRFQASVVYDAPVPSEMSALYSWLDIGERRFDGRVHFGSVELEPDELLMVMSDGLPEHRILMEDQEEVEASSPQLVRTLLASPVLESLEIERLLKHYEERKLLMDDDVSIAVVRLRSTAVLPQHPSSSCLLIDMVSPPVDSSSSGASVLGKRSRADSKRRRKPSLSQRRATQKRKRK